MTKLYSVRHAQPEHDYHEENGESIRMVQKRNIAALTEILAADKDKTIVIETQETAPNTRERI